MQNRKNTSRRVALCGIFGGFAVACMLLGSVLPFSTFLAPAISGALILPVAVEFGPGSGVLLYAAISLLSFFTVPDKEMALIFIFCLGWYPVAKLRLDKIRSKVVQWSTKFVLFNISIVGMYAIILFLFPIASVVAEYKEAGLLFSALLLLGGNVTFAIYDVALSRFLGLYLNVWRPRLMRLH